MKNLTESLEKYLLAVYNISQNNSNIIVKDVANFLKIGGASTSNAIKTLAQKGYLNYVPYGKITLTPKGSDYIELKIYRHNTISDFLNLVLGTDKETADKNAKVIEYFMTEDVLVKFVHFLDFMKQCTCKEPKWLNSCKQTLENGELSGNCHNCINGQSRCGGDCCKHLQ